MPVDWKSSHTRTLHLLTLNLSEKGVSDSLLFDTSDDEELREQLDMHSIIVSCVNEEPLFTADQYLTTVIPYEKKHGPPSVEDLQILTKILCAMKEDSEKVPSLLTDYILKVLCPT
uniref:Uncharacterized protein n=1 Tax=Ailuropoda melanoleuca TaxID=9646 RepID=G1MGF4_AILME